MNYLCWEKEIAKSSNGLKNNQLVPIDNKEINWTIKITNEVVIHLLPLGFVHKTRTNCIWDKHINQW